MPPPRRPRTERPMSESVIRFVVFLAIVGAILLVFAWLPSGCTPMVNRFAFYPSRGPALGESALPPGVRPVTFPTADGETIEGYVVAATSRPDRLLLYFHGNGGNIAQRLPELRAMAGRTGAAVFGSGYRGYGASSGSPSEAGIYRDAEAALGYAREVLGFAPGQIVLVGRSLGTTVATHLASRGETFAGVILITPLSSGRDFGRAHMGPISLMAGRSFDSLGRAASIQEPVLIIHGDADEVVPFAHGQKLFAALPGPKAFVALRGARHNDLEFTDAADYWAAFARFVASPEAATAAPASRPAEG